MKKLSQECILYLLGVGSKRKFDSVNWALSALFGLSVAKTSNGRQFLTHHRYWQRANRMEVA